MGGQTPHRILVGAFGSRLSATETLTRATPLMLTGLAAAVAFRARLWNIGAEGQVFAGAMFAYWVQHGLAGQPMALQLPVVILGAGLDTFSIRNPHASAGLKVYEVDRPASQAWKRARLAEAGLTPPASTSFVSINFETQELGPALTEAGVNLQAPVFFMWLGVVPYLTRDAIMATLKFIATQPGSEVVFDYSEPLENFPPERRQKLEELAARAAAIGEPWLSYFDPAELSNVLHASGFDAIEDLGIPEITNRYLGQENKSSDAGPGGHVLYARVAG